MFDYIRYFIGAAPWIFAWCIALWRGRWPERTYAISGILILFLQPILQRAQHGGAQFNLGATALDMATFLVLLFLAFRSGRIWPVVALAFESISVLTHFSVFWNHDASNFAYVSVAMLAGYLVLFAFAAGLVENEIRRRAERQVAARFRAPSEP